MQVAAELELIRLGLAFSMFGCATYFDLRSRSVNDFLWIPFAAAAGILYVFDFPATYGEGILIVASIALTAALSFVIYRSGLFGGADMLALITFAAIFPLYNYDVPAATIGSGTSFHPFASLIVLTNATVVSVGQIFVNLLRNLTYKGTLFEGLQHEPALKKGLAMIIGHRSKIPRYSFSIEKIVNGRRKFDFSLKPAETAEYEGKQDVWVTSATPFLFFMTAGLIMMVLGGDILAVIFNP